MGWESDPAFYFILFYFADSKLGRVEDGGYLYKQRLCVPARSWGCVVLVSRLPQREARAGSPSADSGGTEYLTATAISVCTNIYTIPISLLNCVITTQEAVRFPGFPRRTSHGSRGFCRRMLRAGWTRAIARPGAG